MSSSSRTSYHYTELYRYDTFYTTKAGFIVPTITGVTSFVSSVTVIYFVLRSQSKLSTTYHRIMCFMSFWDMIASAAISFTTLPMPNDDIYPFAGKRLGNMMTCEVQAFCIFLGGGFTISGNIALNIYYLCAFRYKMDEERIKKVVEPIMFVCSLVISVPLPVIFLIYGELKPSPFNSFCFWGLYHPAQEECGVHDDDFECIQDSGIPTEILAHCIIAGILSGVLVVFVSMSLLISSIYSDEKSQNHRNETMKNTETGEENTSRNNRITEQTTNDKDGVLLLNTPCARLSEAILYVGAFCLTWIPAILGSTFYEARIVQVLKCILHPLQGFFNALIFFYHKIQNIRRSNNNLTFGEALKLLRTRPSEVPEIFLSGMDALSSQANDNRLDQMVNHRPEQYIVRSSSANIIRSSQEQSGFGDVISLDTLQTPSLSLNDLCNAMSSTGVLSYDGSNDPPSLHYGGRHQDHFFSGAVPGPKQRAIISEEKDGDGDEISEDEDEENLSSEKDNASSQYEFWRDESLETSTENDYSRMSSSSRGIKRSSTRGDREQ